MLPQTAQLHSAAVKGYDANAWSIITRYESVQLCSSVQNKLSNTCEFMEPVTVEL